MVDVRKLTKYLDDLQITEPRVVIGHRATRSLDETVIVSRPANFAELLAQLERSLIIFRTQVPVFTVSVPLRYASRLVKYVELTDALSHISRLLQSWLVLIHR
jgi:hypothetical protein